MIVVLDPTNDPIEMQTQWAQRLSSINGSILGVIDNGKRNSQQMLRSLVEALREKYSFEVVWIHKKNASLPMPAVLLEQLKSCHAVVSGIGD